MALPRVEVRDVCGGKRTMGERMEGSMARSVEGSSWGGGLSGDGWEDRLRQGRGQGEYEGGMLSSARGVADEIDRGRREPWRPVLAAEGHAWRRIYMGGQTKEEEEKRLRIRTMRRQGELATFLEERQDHRGHWASRSLSHPPAQN